MEALLSDLNVTKARKEGLEQKLEDLRKGVSDNNERIRVFNAKKRATMAKFSGLAEVAERKLEALREPARESLRTCNPELAAHIDGLEAYLRETRADIRRTMDELSKEEYALDAVALELDEDINKHQRALTKALELMNGAINRLAEGSMQPMSTARSASLTPSLYRLPR
jgi:predicted  nucleic acid-binding Zn-ribbon protein